MSVCVCASVYVNVCAMSACLSLCASSCCICHSASARVCMIVCLRCIFERASVRVCVLVYVGVRVKECLCACKCVVYFCWCENVYE